MATLAKDVTSVPLTCQIHRHLLPLAFKRDGPLVQLCIRYLVGQKMCSRLLIYLFWDTSLSTTLHRKAVRIALAYMRISFLADPFHFPDVLWCRKHSSCLPELCLTFNLCVSIFCYLSPQKKKIIIIIIYEFRYFFNIFFSPMMIAPADLLQFRSMPFTVTDYHQCTMYLCSVPRVGCLELSREARRLERKLPKERPPVGNGWWD